MNRHNLAVLIRDFFKKNSDVDAVEATIKEDEGVVKVRYYNKQKLVAEVTRILMAMSLSGCGFIAGIDEYSPAKPDIIRNDAAEEGAAGDADPPGEGGAPDVVDGGVDSSTDAVAPDAAPEADAATCSLPAAFGCGAAMATPPNQICVHDNANGADNVGTVSPCATCETYTCACVMEAGVTFTGCSYTAEGGIVATIH